MVIFVQACFPQMVIFPGAVKVHCANNGAWIGAMDLVQACFPWMRAEIPRNA
jgi:hypothetical protein